MIEPNFQEVNRIFENHAHQISYKKYFLQTAEMKDCSVMIDGRNFFNQPVKNDQKTCHYIWKITAGQGDNYTIGCLLDYVYFKKSYKMMLIDLSKKKKKKEKRKQELNTSPKTIKQVNITGNLDRVGIVIMYFIIEEGNKPF